MNKTLQTLLIYGPTATGKTALAISLAKKLNGEIISVDSRQVYKGLDIGTGKIGFDSKVEKHYGYWIVDGAKIHGFDLVEPVDNFSAADFVKFANDSIIRIIEQNKLPIVVGGTGFYIKALLSGIGTIGIPANPKLRSKLEKLSVSELYRQLRQIDKNRALKMNQSDRVNPRRLIRAIEIAMTFRTNHSHSGVAMTTIESRSLGPHPARHAKTASSASRFVSLRSRMTDTLIIGLTAPNNYLYHLADKWISTRLEKGMIEEIQHLLNQKIDPRWLDNLGLECRWLTRYLLGKIDYDQAIERLRGDIHSFVRRQKTWFKKLKGIQLFDISQSSWQGKLEKTVKDWYHTDSSGAGTTAKN